MEVSVKKRVREEDENSHTCSVKKFKGVRRRSWGRWVSEIREPHTQTRIWLGSFATQEMAARAYDVGLLYLHGPSAALNFSDSPSRLPSLSEVTVKSIQAAAALAAANHADDDCSPLSPKCSGLRETFQDTSAHHELASGVNLEDYGLAFDMARAMLLPLEVATCYIEQDVEELREDSEEWFKLWEPVLWTQSSSLTW